MTTSFPAVMWFWLPFGLLQVTAGYTSTFVAQYSGASRPHRVGPAVWQGIYFAVFAGLLMMFLAPAAPALIAVKWKTMRVIEPVLDADGESTSAEHGVLWAGFPNRPD